MYTCSGAEVVTRGCAASGDVGCTYVCQCFWCRLRRDMLLRFGQVQRGGDDVIIRSRDHHGRPAHQRRHRLPAVNYSF